jgi:hypothetical protein
MKTSTKTITVYRGIVKDRMSGDRIPTQRNPTWESAYRAAEALAKRKGLTGDRYAIDVDCEIADVK